MSHEQPRAEAGSAHETCSAAFTPAPAPALAPSPAPAPQQAVPKESSASSSVAGSDSLHHIQVGYEELTKYREFKARDPQDDDDSALGDDDASTTTSLRSSIMQFREENGRTYHSFAESDLQHHLFSLTFGGNLYVAPLDERKIGRVLDAGTGTGIWAIDIDDLEMEWAYRHPFDFIFGRMLTGSIGDWPKFMRQSFEGLNSGGWIELQDIIMMPKCDDGTMSDDSALKTWGDKLLESCKTLKRDGDSAMRYKQHMTDAGFINVTEVVYKWPTNPWPAEQHYRDLGFWSYHNAAGGASGLSMALLTRCLGWSKDQVELFLASVKKDLKNKQIHSWWPM
ncbi:hypothetical protein E4U21_002010 [Claviceps maximensis]|nr:hypothetical protein E4U21_002010 [Claviceps maximensis]